MKPTRIAGRWREGYVLDLHTVSSTYIGADEYGHPMFDTKRSELGGLLLRLKYRGDETALAPIVDALVGFVDVWRPGATLLVPVPPSRARSRQPVHLIAMALAARMGIPCALQAVTRVREVPELKNVYDLDDRLRLLAGAHRVDVDAVRGQRVLLLDDLYRSGATMNAVAGSLYEEGAVGDVCALAVTRTRSAV